MQRVLICDHEPDLAAPVELNLKDAGFAVDVPHTREAARLLARPHRQDLVLLDVRRPDVSGSELCRRLKKVETVGGVGYRLAHEDSTSSPGGSPL